LSALGRNKRENRDEAPLHIVSIILSPPDVALQLPCNQPLELWVFIASQVSNTIAESEKPLEGLDAYIG